MDINRESFILVRLFRWDNDQRDQIDQNPWHTARNESDKHRESEPERADAEELAKSAAYPGDDSVMF